MVRQKGINEKDTLEKKTDEPLCQEAGEMLEKLKYPMDTGCLMQAL